MKNSYNDVKIIEKAIVKMQVPRNKNAPSKVFFT